VDLPARKRKEHQCVCLPDPETAVVRAYVSVLADLTMCSSPGARNQLGIANPDIKIDGYARMSSSFG
jgi:hypothetical protein